MLKNFDFSLLQSDDFNEISVCQAIINPILQALGFVIKNPKSPQPLEMKLAEGRKMDIQLGTHAANPVNLIPDYVLYRAQKEFCILDAKAPSEKIHKDGKHYKQAQSYALGFECDFFALCNGKEFVIYKFGSGEIVLQIDIEKELNAKFAALQGFFAGKKPTPQPTPSKQSDEWYLSREIPKAIKAPKKQEAKRHFGCNAYFTRQSWDVVKQNIENFTAEGDVVLDSFGGSGVTAIEAMMSGRLGIHTDLNPLSIFMVKALTASVNLGDFWELSEEILKEFTKLRPKNEKETKAILKGAKHYPNAIDEEFGETASLKKQDEILWIPKDEPLPKGSDTPSVLGLFTQIQLAELAILRKLIFRHTTPSGTKEQRTIKRNLRYSLLLAFRNTLTMCNLTYHDTEKRKGKGGNTSIYLAYRYRIPKKPTFLNVADVFGGKIKLVANGKKELESSPNFYNAYFAPLNRVIKDFKGAMMSQRQNLEKTDSILDKTNGEKIFQADATNLKEIENESVDFIYTDPPYGAKIPYLDLSTLWNAWFDFSVDLNLKEKECIEKGSLNKTREGYYDLMKQSLQEMYRVLKFNRWLVFVFQHQDPQLWRVLRKSAEEIGFEYIQTLRQSNGQTTFKQRQFTAIMVSGQLLVYFRKVKKAGAGVMKPLNEKSLVQTAKEYIIENDGASFAEINDLLITKAMNEGFLDEYLEVNDLKHFVLQHFSYDENSKKYHCIEAQEQGIPLDKKTKYFLVNYFNKCKKENRPALFSDICFEVIPKLVNGVTPDNRYIKEILQEIAVVADEKTGEWRLKGKEPSLFDGI